MTSVTPTLPYLLLQAANIPSIPRVVSQVLKELDNEDSQPSVIATLVGSDPMLVARIIKLANSAFFRTIRDVHSVEEAFTILGFSHIRALVTAVALSSSFRTVPGINLESFWRYSLNTAKMAKPLARSLRLNDGAAFTIGLVHAIGELVLHMSATDAIKSLREKGSNWYGLDRIAQERSLLDYSYVEVTQAFAKHWEFPTTMVESLGRLEDPMSGNTLDKLAAVVHMSSWRARTVELKMDEAAMIATFPDVVALMLNLDMNNVLHNQPSEWTSSSEVAMFLGS